MEKIKTKNILVTGASSGIGLALCKLLVRDHDCHVFLGSRNLKKGTFYITPLKIDLFCLHCVGENALKTIVEEAPEKANRIEVLQIDVSEYESVLSAAKFLQHRNVKLYALVNNAGIGFATMEDAMIMMNTNYYGPKRVTEVFIDLIDDINGRIVNTSSSGALEWLEKQVLHDYH